MNDTPATVQEVHATAYTVPTETPEADGTLSWDSTTLVLVRIRAGGEDGLGYTYSAPAAAALINDALAKHLHGIDAFSPRQGYDRLRAAVRNLGQSGIASCAVSALDVALWDLKAKLLGVSVDVLIGRVRNRVPVYGSGGFTNYSVEKLCEQLAGWVEDGIWQVKMKVGTASETDVSRVRAVREAIGPDTGLFVDANGGYRRKEALAKAHAFADLGVGWFEEPVSSLDIEGLRLLRDRGPAGMAIAAGEYAYLPTDFHRLLTGGGVDCLQVDVTRCGGITGVLAASALAEAFELPISAHTAPSLHRALGCALRRMEHIEYFYDHVRIEHMFFEGAARAFDGYLHSTDAAGLGLVFKAADAQAFRN